jgi:hypothetical protein
MLLFGWRQATANGSRTPDSIMGAAWVLAACRGGADCGPTNDALPLFICREGIELGCTERYTAIDELTEKLNSSDLDQASLLAQDIQANLLYRDPSRLKTFLPLMQ